MTQPLAIKATVAAPVYELRVSTAGLGDERFEVWQIPGPATPQLTTPRRVGGLRGRNLELVEHRVRRRLGGCGYPSGVADWRAGDCRSLGGCCPFAWAPVPDARADAQPRPDAIGRRRYRCHGPGGGRVLARHGDAPTESATDSHGASRDAHGAEGASVMRARAQVAFHHKHR